MDSNNNDHQESIVEDVTVLKEEKDEQGGEQGPTKRSRLAVCEVCGVSDSKYTCPACMVKFCSLGCSKKHKEESACTGVRSKTSYVSMLDFTDTNLMSDYQFLEQITHTSDNAKRLIGPKINHHQPHDQQKINKDDSQIPQTQNLPYNLRQIQLQAKKRGIGLHLLPKGMSKMIANTTRYDKENDKIFWRVEWVLNDSFGQPQKMEDKKVDENLTLSAVLSKHFDDIPTRHRFRKLFSKEGAEGQFDFSSLKYLVAAEFIKGEKSFHDINPNNPIKEAFSGIHIVEYPIFLVVRQEDLKGYKIAPPDENLLRTPFGEGDGSEIKEKGDFKGKGYEKEKGTKRFYKDSRNYRSSPSFNKHYDNNSSGSSYRDNRYNNNSNNNNNNNNNSSANASGPS